MTKLTPNEISRNLTGEAERKYADSVPSPLPSPKTPEDRIALQERIDRDNAEVAAAHAAEEEAAKERGAAPSIYPEGSPQTRESYRSTPPEERGPGYSAALPLDGAQPPEAIASAMVEHIITETRPLSDDERLANLEKSVASLVTSLKVLVGTISNLATVVERIQKHQR